MSLVESQVADFGATEDMTVNYIVNERFSQRAIDVWKLLIEAEAKGMNRHTVIGHLKDTIAALTPFVDKPIVRVAVWCAGKMHVMYIDPLEEQTIHCSSNNYPVPTLAEGIDHNAEGTNKAVNPSDGSDEN